MNAISKFNKAAGVPVYLYEFDHVLSFDAWGPNYTYTFQSPTISLTYKSL